MVYLQKLSDGQGPSVFFFAAGIADSFYFLRIFMPRFIYLLFIIFIKYF